MAQECEISTDPVDEENVDLIRDFCEHIVTQFKVIVENAVIIVDNAYEIKIPHLVILPEVNGIRKLQLKDDGATIINEAFTVKVQKSSELCVVKEIENSEARIAITALHLNLLSPEKLPSNFSISSSQSTKSVNFHLNINILYLKYGPIKAVLNDVALNHKGDFAIGHYQGFWNDSKVILDSPIQTHNITGNYKDALICVNEPVNLNVENKQILMEIIELIRSFDLKHMNTADNCNEIVKPRNFDIKIIALNLDFDEKWKIIVNFGNVDSQRITFEELNVILKHSETALRLKDFDYRFNAEKIHNTRESSPFSEMLRFVENVELLTLENEKVLYERFSEFSNRLSIGKIDCKIDIKDLLNIMKDDLHKSIIESKDSNTNNFDFNLLGTIKNFDIRLKMTGATISSKIQDVNLLLTKDLFDIRADKLTSLRLNDFIICQMGKCSFTKYKNINLSGLNGVDLNIPIDLNDILKDDLALIQDKYMIKSDTDHLDSITQILLENLKIKIATNDVCEPVKSEFRIEEIIIKRDGFQNIVFVESAKMILNANEIFDSGLVRIDLNQCWEIKNHCCNLNLSPERVIDLADFVQFWSEIISPEMEEIKPEAIFKAETDEEVGFSVDKNTKSEQEPYIDSEQEMIETKTFNIEELMEDVDEEFFVAKQDSGFTEKSEMIMKFVNIGLNVKLKLENFEELNVSLTGIEGSVEREKVKIRIKKGEIRRESELILSNWRRGPDAKSRIAMEEGTFLVLEAERTESDICGIDEYNLRAGVSPMRLFLDSQILDFFTNFAAGIKTSEAFGSNDSKQQLKGLKGFIFFNKVTVSALPIKFDYQPALQGAEICLPRIELRGVKGVGALPSSIASAWIPQLKGDRLKEVLKTGLLPVRTVVKVGNGFADLVLLPWRLAYQPNLELINQSDDTSQLGDGSHEIVSHFHYGSHALNSSSHSHARTAAQIRKSSKQIGMEALKLTSALATTTFELLNPTSKTDMDAKDLQGGIQEAAKLIVALPKRQKSRFERMNLLQAVPLVIWDSTSVTIGAIAKTLQGLAAEFDNDSD